MNQAIVDLGYGDSGKGISTAFLCSKHNSIDTIVIRSNGGHQAGHTVIYDGFKHVFSQFGSGTLQGFPTYISKYCTIYPPSMQREYEYIKQYTPILYCDRMTMITTPFDIDYNRLLEKSNKHGSVGMGFGQTIQRNEDNYKLFAEDMYYENIFKAKLFNIATKYYKISEEEANIEIDAFWQQCQLVINSKYFSCTTQVIIDSHYKNKIYESAQGILLDQEFGFFPNVTRSYTTSKNILELCPNLDEIYYCMRTYQTRHGNGFMTNENKPVPVLDMKNGEETNKKHNYQGDFRISEIDFNLIEYALNCDNNYSVLVPSKNLIITCCDQLELSDENMQKLISLELFDSIYKSYSPDYKDIIKIY